MLRFHLEYFDALSQVQELASDLVHEDSWKEWDSQKLKTLIDIIKTVLIEMYVLPEEKRREERTIKSIKQHKIRIFAR